MASLRPLLKSEDWMSLWIGLLIFALSLGLLVGVDILGWAVKTNVWVTAGQALEANIPRFMLGFTVIFLVSYVCWFLGHYAYIAATPDKLESLGIGWSMNLTGEAGYILALLVGLVISWVFFHGITPPVVAG